MGGRYSCLLVVRRLYGTYLVGISNSISRKKGFSIRPGSFCRSEIRPPTRSNLNPASRTRFGVNERSGSRTILVARRFCFQRDSALFIT